MVEKIEIGVSRLDNIVSGGFPIPSTILISGAPGTGKTTLAVQSLFHGAHKGETGLYLTVLGEPTDALKSFTASFKFYDQKLIDEGKIVFEDIGQVLREDPYGALTAVQELVDEHKPRRLVMDPITSMEDTLGAQRYRMFLYDFVRLSRGYKTLSMVVAEFRLDDIANHPESYVADGIVSLFMVEEGVHRYRNMAILKLRGVEHTLDTLRCEITANGFDVLGVPVD